jgi:hypothetical protein
MDEIELGLAFLFGSLTLSLHWAASRPPIRPGKAVGTLSAPPIASITPTDDLRSVSWNDMRLLPGPARQATQREIRCVGREEPHGRRRRPLLIR